MIIRANLSNLTFIKFYLNVKKSLIFIKFELCDLIFKQLALNFLFEFNNLFSYFIFNFKKCLYLLDNS